MPLEGLIDLEAEKARLAKEKEQIEKEIAKAEQRLNNPKFAEKAPKEVLDEHRERLENWKSKLAQTVEALERMQ